MKDQSIVEKTAAYIDGHLKEDLSLERLAKEMHYSKFYLERVFKENMGCTVYQYIKRRRLTEAARELLETDKPIVEIAFEARYSTQQAFTLAFRQVYACTPPRSSGASAKNLSPAQEEGWPHEHNTICCTAN